jgi:type VI secretion system protein ImpA
MPTAPLLDLEALARPIADDNAVGEDLRADSSPSSIYYRLKDARSTARAEERQLTAEGESGAIPDQWRVLLDLGPAVLSERTKDLEVAAWMIEALVRYHGFAGLRDGFRLITALVGSFWDGIYPLPDEDGIETRIAPLTGLNGEGADGTLILPIRQIRLTEPGDQGAMAFWHHEAASALARITDDDKRAKRIKAGAVTMEQFNTTVQATSPAFFQRLLDDARESTEAFAALEAKLGEVCGSDAPPTGAIRSAMADVIGLAQFISKDRLPIAAVEAEAEAGAAEEAGDAAAPAAGARPAGGASDAINSREDAFRLILKAAEWFKRNEPHSPLSYTLENLVRRGRMPLRELLQELIPDDGARNQFLSLAGIRPQEGGD